MTRVDDSISVSLFIMIFVGVPIVVKTLLALERALEGDWVMLLAFWNTGWFPIMCATFALCAAILIVGAMSE